MGAIGVISYAGDDRIGEQSFEGDAHDCEGA
jgi:hypothetical protein